MADYDFRALGPTALLLAWFRQFSDIPFAAEVARVTGAEEAARSLMGAGGVALEDLVNNAPYSEARYKSILSAVRRLGLRQVLEFGSGLSFRSMAVAGDPEMLYVETDLPEIVELKHRVISQIPAMGALAARGRSFFLTANILSWDEIEAALYPLSPARPVAVVHEGLLSYMSLDEKELAARNVRKVLERCGGAWITPDLHTHGDLERQDRKDPNSTRGVAVVAQATRRAFSATAFDDDDHIIRFFSGLGFSAEVRPQIDGSFELSSLRSLNLPPEYMDDARPRVWVLRLSCAS